jgi:ubiquinone/menaquinone biosynthesis C-methylase UbiE
MIAPDFESLYIRLRQKEGRMYTDEEVAQLPSITSSHQHFKEWQLRKDSSQKLVDHLKKRNKPYHILEIGCGNGWLSHQLSTVPQSNVIGTDINFAEVQQAAKVFEKNTNLHFIYGNAESDLFQEKQFDVIVFAASIQYFPSFTEIIRNTLKLLKPNGEIHIIDSHFYPLSGIGAAKQRSLLYYQAAGFPEMAHLYFHHVLDDLEQFNHSILYDPTGLFNRFLRNKNPFHWICIRS